MPNAQITPELIRKHIDRLAKIVVKGHKRTSKKGKIFSVKQHDRDLARLQAAVDVAKKALKGKKKDSEEYKDAWLKLTYARDDLATHKKNSTFEFGHTWRR